MTTASPSKTLVFIPMYNCERQVPRVIARLTPEALAYVDEIIVVDNGSRDGSVGAATAALEKLSALYGQSKGVGHVPKASILVNTHNYNLGGSHKVAFNYALDNAFTHVIVLHGDDQADISDLLPLLSAGVHTDFDQLLGSRFMRGSKLSGYSTFRTFGNHVFNTYFSLAARSRIHDLGSGLNMYRTSYLASRFYMTFPDTLMFNNHMVLAGVRRKARTHFFPISWREEDQRSNVKLVRQAIKTALLPLSYAAGPDAFLARDFSSRASKDYTYGVRWSNKPAGVQGAAVGAASFVSASHA